MKLKNKVAKGAKKSKNSNAIIYKKSLNKNISFQDGLKVEKIKYF